MKQVTLFFALLVFSTVSLFAQRKSTKAEIDASHIINYSNTVITFGNAYNGDLKNYIYIIENADYNLSRVLKNPNLQPFAVNCSDFSIQRSQQQEYTKALATVQAFPEKEGMKIAVDQGQNNLKDITTWCKQLSDYFSTKAYQEDADSKQYNLIKDSLTSHVEKAQSSWAEASRLASVAGNKAELVFLEKSPIASFVIPMKKDLIELDAILGNLNNKNIDWTATSEEVKKLSVTLEQNKDISTKDVSKLSDFYYREVYQNYYNNLEECTSYLDKVVTGLQNNPDDTESVSNLYQYVKSYYNKAIENYNTFIKQ